jgi:general transcription factor 3C polypeptide 4
LPISAGYVACIWSAYVVDDIGSEFQQNYSEDQQKQVECGQIALQNLSAISQRVLHTIIHHLAGVVRFLSCLSTIISLSFLLAHTSKANDAPFVSRMLAQSLLPGASPDLSREALTLQAALIAHDTQFLSDNLTERCPACHVEIPLQDIANAVCSNGHTWGADLDFDYS